MSIRRVLALAVRIIHHLWIGMWVISAVVWLANHFGVIELVPLTSSFTTHFLACGMLAVMVGQVLMCDRRLKPHCPLLYLQRSIQIFDGTKTGRIAEPLLKQFIAADWPDESFGWGVCLSLLVFWTWTLTIPS